MKKLDIELLKWDSGKSKMKPETKKKYIVFVKYGNDVPMVAVGVPNLDSEYNLYVDLGDNLKMAYVATDENYFKAVKRSLAFNKDYKVTRMYI